MYNPRDSITIEAKKNKQKENTSDIEKSSLIERTSTINNSFEMKEMPEEEQKEEKDKITLDSSKSKEHINACLNIRRDDIENAIPYSPQYSSSLKTLKSVYPEGKERDIAVLKLMCTFLPEYSRTYKGSKKLDNFMAQINQLQTQLVTDHDNGLNKQEDDFISQMRFMTEHDEDAVQSFGTSYDSTYHFSPSQLEGVRKVDQWLLHKITKDKADYVMNLLSRPVEERIFLYYSIERDRAGAIDESDVLISQSKYVPNLYEFKEQVLASRFKFWRRWRKAVYWDKFDKAEAGLPLFRLCSKNRTEAERFEDEDSLERTKPQENAGFIVKEPEAGEEVAKGTITSDAVALALLRDAMFRYEKAPDDITKESIQKEISIYKTRVAEEIAALEEKDSVFSEVMGAIFSTISTQGTDLNKYSTIFKNTFAGIKNIPREGIISKTGYEFTGVMGDYMDGITTLKGVLGLITLVNTAKGIAKTKQTVKSLDNWEKSLTIEKTFMKPVSGVFSALKAISTVAKKAGAASQGLSTLKDVTKLGSKVTNFASHAMNIQKHITLTNQQLKMSSFNDFIKNQKLVHGEAGTLEKAAENKEDFKEYKRKVYQDNMAKLVSKKLVRERVNAVFETVTNSLTTASLFVTATGASGALMVAGAAVSVASMITNWAIKRSDSKSLVDTFLNFDKWKEVHPEEKDEDVLRRKLAGKLGFATIKAVAAHAIKTYASFILERFKALCEKNRPKGEGAAEAFVEMEAYKKLATALGVKFDPKNNVVPNLKVLIARLS